MALAEPSPAQAPAPPAQAPEPRSHRGFGRLRLIAEAVIFRHTLFSLPFALAALLLETAGRPPVWKLLWIVVAVVAGRNAANAINRLVDRDIDAANPRTAGRHLPSGRLGQRDLWIFTAAMLALLILAAAMLGWICLAFLWVPAIAIFGYSYTKRFTWLCHYWLGATCAIATMGALIAVSGRVFELRFFVLSAAVASWVAGFDILYALQDIAVDRAQGLHSIPERFGPLWARLIAAGSHGATLLLLASAPLFWKLGSAYLVALGAAAILLAVEHLVALGGSERHIRIAAYGINEILPLVVLASVAVDLYLL
jgi:4-hydroxybenzoate polyprenyltransferase